MRDLRRVCRRRRKADDGLSDLRAERKRLEEEVQQLRAAVQIYTFLAEELAESTRKMREAA